MAEVDSSLIRKGLWVNWEVGGRVLGSTITTSTHVGNILVAITALVIALAMGHLWNIALFAYHQWQARKPSGDGLSRQQQVIFRTSPSPASFVVDFIKLHRAWRKQVPNAFVRCLFPCLIGFLFLLATLAASTFSSSVVSYNDLTVLVDSPTCAMVDGYKVYELAAASSTVSTYNEDTRAAALAYAKECYTGSSIPSQCNVYVQPRIVSSQSMVPCPFQDNMCIGSGNVAVQFDSGFVDSRNDLGFNTPSQDRIQLRKTTTCAPITLDGHTSTVNGSEQQKYMAWRKVLPEEQFIALQYGEFLAAQDPLPNTSATYSLASTNITFDYSTDVVSYMADPALQQFNSWAPLPALQNSDADTTLIWVLLNSVTLSQPCNDPVFSSHHQIVINEYNNGTYYQPDHPVGIIGCSEQYQICINDGKQCSPMQPSRATTFEDLPTGMNDIQVELTRLLTEAVNLYSIGTSYSLTDQALQIGAQVLGGLLAEVPSDQWIREMNWGADIVWGGLQKVLLDHATGGQSVPDAALIKPNTSASSTLCHAQLVHKAGGFANLKVFAFAFTIAVAGLFILIDVVVLKGLLFTKHFPGAHNPRIGRWVQDGVLQLQRRAYQDEGYATWTRSDEEIPVTGMSELPAWASGAPNQQGKAFTYENTFSEPKMPQFYADSISTPSTEPSVIEATLDGPFRFQPEIVSTPPASGWNGTSKKHSTPNFIS